SLDALIQYAEEPSPMVRWHSLLFTIHWDAQCHHSNIYISNAVATAIVKPPNVGTQITLKAPTADLCILEHSTNALVSSL
ncbi:hypothetical protein BDR04DRAFT_967865, partial [Suillus decipiens]